IDAILAAGRLDDGVHEPAVAVEDVEADASRVAAREAVVQLRPRDAAVLAAVDAAARAAAVESPRAALALVHRRIEHIGVLWIHHEVGGTGVLVDEQRPRPRLAAVGRPEHA